MKDLIIVGGGILGLAVAFQALQATPDLAVTLLEKESVVGQHQTGHNSGVIHSGIYYKPGSHRAHLCRAGKGEMEAFCRAEGIPFDICGKVIVALNETELPALQTIFERGQANGVDCHLIDRERLLEIEPHVAGIRAIHVPEAGIVDYKEVCRRLAARIVEMGGEIQTDVHVTAIEERSKEVVVSSNSGDWTTRQVVACAGLYSDRVARLVPETNHHIKIVPFRGEYYDLKPSAHHLCRGLIYPVPDPRFPFLGVHFTRVISGGVECGPNAVLAFAREGYRKSDVNVADLWESLGYVGFRRLAAKYWRTGLGEIWRSVNKQAFVTALQRLVPEIQAKDLESAPAGVRAQAVIPEGKLLDDFAFAQTARTLHVVNAASPAATSSLAIGKHILAQLSS